MPVGLAYGLVVVIWSTTPLGIRWSVESVHFLDALIARMLIACVLCWGWLALHRQALPWHRRALASYLAAALGMVGAMGLSYYSAQWLGSGLISIMFGLSPIFTGLAAWWLLAERNFTPLKLLGLAIALFGLLLVFYKELTLDWQMLPALAANLLGVWLFALSAVLVQKARAGLTPLQQTTGALTLSMPFFALAWLLLRPEWVMQPGLRSLSAIVYLGLAGSLLGFLCYFHVLAHLSASQVNLIPIITPVFALLLGSWLNNEQLPPETLLGGALILLALVLYFSDGRWQRYRLKRQATLLERASH